MSYRTTEAIVDAYKKVKEEGADKVKVTSESNDTITAYKVGKIIRIDVKIKED